jgi:hypothetical protein
MWYINRFYKFKQYKKKVSRIAGVIENTTLGEAFKYFGDRQLLNDDGSESRYTGNSAYESIEPVEPERLQWQVRVVGNNILLANTNKILAKFIPDNSRESNEINDWNIIIDLFPHTEEIVKELESSIGNDFDMFIKSILDGSSNIIDARISIEVKRILNDIGITDDAIIRNVQEIASECFKTSINKNKASLQKLQQYSIKNMNNLEINDLYELEHLSAMLWLYTREDFDDLISSKLFMLFERHDENLKSIDNALRQTDS